MTEETNEQIVKIKGEKDKLTVNAKLATLTYAVLASVGIGAPIIERAIGMNPAEIAELERVAIPLVVAGSGVFAYKIKNYFSSQKQLDEQIRQLEEEPDTVIEEDKGMGL